MQASVDAMLQEEYLAVQDMNANKMHASLQIVTSAMTVMGEIFKTMDQSLEGMQTGK